METQDSTSKKSIRVQTEDEDQAAVTPQAASIYDAEIAPEIPRVGIETDMAEGPSQCTTSKKPRTRSIGPASIDSPHKVSMVHYDLLAQAKEGTLNLEEIRTIPELAKVGKMGNTILHLMSLWWGDFLKPVFIAVMEAIPDLYRMQDEDRRTVLDRNASERKQNQFAAFFYEKYPSEMIVLIRTNPQYLLFLLPIWRHVDWSRIFRELSDLLPSQMDDSGNTFLNHLIIFLLNHNDSDSGRFVENIMTDVINAAPSILQVTNKEGKSVYQYCIDAIESDRLRDLTEEENHESNEASTHFWDSDDSDIETEGYSSEEPGEEERSDGKATLQQNVNDYSTASVLHKISIILKKETLRHVSDADEALKLIYGKDRSDCDKDREVEIDLDFNDFGNINDPDALVRLTVLAGLHLNDLLRSIRLPASKTNEFADLQTRQEGFIKFFRQLKEVHNLKGVVTLQVDESIDRPCPDEMIESVLKDVEIDTLDWRKTDMCSMAIVNATPNVRYLHLYSSGNRAVLRSWSAPDGLPLLKHLKEVKLSVLEDRVETPQAVRTYIEEFIHRLEENRHDSKSCSVQVSYQIHRTSGLTWSSTLFGKDSTAPRFRLSWMTRLQEFCEFIDHNAFHDRQINASPKVAAIDDGVDVVQFKTGREPRIVAGISFAMSASHTFSNPWFFSARGHGTMTAKVICTLCPKADMYIVKIDKDTHGTIPSIEKSLQWCISKKVDIICLGVALTRSATKEHYSLRALLVEAFRQGITVLMPVFETSIEDSTGQADFLHAGVLKIAASKWNGSVELPPPMTADFTLLDDISDLSHDEPSFSDVKGNSIATAVATGLAAAILLCVRSSDAPDARDKTGLHPNTREARYRHFGSDEIARIFSRLLGKRDSKTIMVGKLTRFIQGDARHCFQRIARRFQEIASNADSDVNFDEPEVFRSGC